MSPNRFYRGQRGPHFRRHLALVALLALVGELDHLLEGQLAHLGALYTGPEELAPARTSQTARGSSWRRERVRLAAGQETSANEAAERAIYQHDTSQELSPIARTLALLQSYLPLIDLSVNLAGDAHERFPMGQLDASIDLYYRGQFAGNMSLDELTLMSVKAATRTAPIPLHTSFGYETRELMRQGSLPVRDERLCAAQLQHLVKRLEQALAMGLGLAAGEQPIGTALPGAATLVDNLEARQIYRSLDLDLMRWLDTFGRVPADLLRGNIKWYGSYQSCMASRLRPLSADRRRQPPRAEPKNEQPRDQQAAIKFRYCLGALKSLGWRASERLEAERSEISANRSRWTDYGVGTVDINRNNYFIRLGLCLPEACDSSALWRRENAASIERLAKFGLAKPFNSDHYQLAELYCLPDERSPLRQIPVLGKLLLLAALLWLGLIGAATTIHLSVDKFYTKTVDSIRARRDRKLVRLLGREVLRGQQQKRAVRERRQKEGAEAEAEAEDEDEDEEERQNEFHESDFLNVRLNWVKLNMFLQERAREIVPGVDLIDCLSLYANWLKYTRRVKEAVVELHEEERASQGRRLQNELLLHQALVEAATTPVENCSGARGAQTDDNAGQQMLREAPNGDSSAQLARSAAKSCEAAGAPSTPERAAVEGHSAGEPGGQRRRVHTSSLNALKVIALVWIIAGHCIFYLGSAISNSALLSLYLPTVISFALSNGALYITELFFIITGCLSSYLTFKYNTQRLSWPAAHASAEEADKQRHQADKHSSPAGQSAAMSERLFKAPFWALLLANRYLRILPTYLLVYSFVKLVSLYAGGQGQTWDYAVSENSMRRHCAQESWWPVLTLTTNFVDIYKHCIVGGWYLSVDMQFAALSVPLLVLLAHAQRHPQDPASGTGSDDSLVRLRKLTGRAGGRDESSSIGGHPAESGQRARFVARLGRKVWLSYGLVAGLALASGLAAMLYAVLFSPVDMSYIISFSPHTIALLSQNIGMYTNTLFRFRAFASGLLLGHLLYLYEFRLLKLPDFVQRHGSKLSVLLFALGCATMLLPVLYPPGKIKLSHDITAIGMVATALAVDIFACLLIFLVCIGKAPKLALFVLNSPFWSLLSSLSLSAFLVHAEVIVLLTSQLEPPPSTSYALLYFVFSATLLLTYSLALALYLAFELPLSRLIEAAMRSFVFMERNLKQRTRPAASSNGNK